MDTGLIARDGETLTVSSVPSRAALAKAAMQLVPASSVLGFRLNAKARLRGRFLLDGETVEIALAGREMQCPAESALVAENGQALLLTPGRKDGAQGAAVSDGVILAPMPGRVVSVNVVSGQEVTRGQTLLTLEAMKMEHALTAPFDGTVAELKGRPGRAGAGRYLFGPHCGTEILIAAAGGRKGMRSTAR